jgi:hypothetical protein
LQFTQLESKAEDGPALQFPGGLEAGRQQHTPPQFIPQGSGRCRKELTSTGAVRVIEKANNSQPPQNLFLKNAMNDFGLNYAFGYKDKTKLPRKLAFSFCTPLNFLTTGICTCPRNDKLLPSLIRKPGER